ncbi:MAG: hypothetical protein AAFR75_05435 [Pseudomonadota bacterium]
MPALNKSKSEGLPDWLFTPRMAVATGVVVAILFGQVMWFVNWVGEVPIPRDWSPECFVYGSKNTSVSSQFSDYKQYERRQIEKHADMFGQEMLRLATRCRPGDCSKKSRRSYQSRLEIYLKYRAKAFTKAPHVFGFEGYGLVRQIYGTALANQVVMDMRERYQAGLLKDFSSTGYGAAGRMLLFREIRDFRPCDWPSSTIPASTRGD